MRSKHYDILVVDDDADDRLMLGEAFAELHCHDRVTMYESGTLFLQETNTLKTLSPLPLLVVLDYNLPGADGREILRRLKSDDVLQAIPVVMYSTGMSRTQQADCVAAGALKCFEKGLTYDDVLDFARQLCAEAFNKSAQVS
jgi:CheY-like chemotaxis protein